MFWRSEEKVFQGVRIDPRNDQDKFYSSLNLLNNHLPQCATVLKDEKSQY
jgi:hypothetical protein